MTDLPRHDPFALVTVRVEPERHGVEGWFSGLGLVGAEEVTVQRFADPVLQSSMDRVLASLPMDTLAAEVDVDGDAQGVRVIGAVRTKGGCSLLAGAAYVFGGTWSGHIGIRKVW